MGNGVVGSKCGSQKTSISIKLKVDGALSRRGERGREKVALCAVMAFLAVIFSVSFQMKFFSRRAKGMARGRGPCGLRRSSISVFIRDAILSSCPELR